MLRRSDGCWYLATIAFQALTLCCCSSGADREFRLVTFTPFLPPVRSACHDRMRDVLMMGILRKVNLT